MTTTELKEKIAEVAEQEWFKTVSWNFFGTEIRGLSAIYEFVNQQIEGWGKYENLPNEFTAIKTYFTNVRDHIASFVNNISSYRNNLQNYWNNQVTNNNRNIRLIAYSAPEVAFLLKVFSETQQYYNGAYQFLIGDTYNVSINSKELLYGAILAYEYTLKDKTEITSRKKAEQSSISKLRNDFQQYLTESENQIVEHIKKTNDSYTEYTQKIDELKNEKEKLFSDWFESTKNEQWQNWFENTKTEQWQKWFDPAIKRIAELENTYKEKLKLEEPAKYWSERAQKLKKQAWWALGVFILLVIIVCSFLSFVLVKTPKDLLENLFNGNIGGAIKWAIVFTTLISFFAYTIRAVSKVMFSSFHLARDCEERHTLTYFYLSLLKDAKVADSERQLIIQSLFSRADTGLLKEDSSPTMPNDVISKFTPIK